MRRERDSNPRGIQSLWAYTSLSRRFSTTEHLSQGENSLPIKIKKKQLTCCFPAERQGFEPRVPRGTTVFKTAAIDHSATSPKLLFRSAFC